MSVEGLSRIDTPKQIVRPLRDCEHMPLYTTEQLFFGVCHLVPMSTPYPAMKERAPLYIASANKPKVLFADYFHAVKVLLGQGKPTLDIAAELEISNHTVSYWIKKDPTLKALSKSRTNRGGEQRSRKNFEAHESAIREDMETMSWYALSKKYKCHQYTLQRLLAEAK